MEYRVKQQQTFKEFIGGALYNLMKLGTGNVTHHRVNTRLAALNENWRKFSVNHEAILLANTKLSAEERSQIRHLSYFRQNHFSEVQENYLEALEKMTELLDRGSSNLRDTSSTSTSAAISSLWHHGSRLPRIDPPKFDGNPADWLPFKDLF